MSTEMQHGNLILQWLNHCTPSQRHRLAERIKEHLEAAQLHREERGGGATSTQIMSTVLFVECACDLDLRPLELHGLMRDPKAQSLEAVAELAMNQLLGVTCVEDSPVGRISQQTVQADERAG
ncbi:MAG: hypothetical protein P8L37_09125 [Phycisphaerales bacterium]|nr:hypothetical protein [Phycisphaerales bacterium]